MHNLLHDEIDELEDLRELARESVQSVREKLIASISSEDDLESIFSDAATLVGNELGDLTTSAVHMGADFARRREAAK